MEELKFIKSVDSYVFITDIYDGFGYRVKIRKWKNHDNISVNIEKIEDELLPDIMINKNKEAYFSFDNMKNLTKDEVKRMIKLTEGKAFALANKAINDLIKENSVL